ncbi:hypothetical protein [Chitinophaga rhizophila]|uniref:Uncharacterized protein n=1 Tax=Chitinophaga rhizophila TaxID=2866212 RepID=A0ABS7GKL9_9BACT|nr:hypothetical protein [Chitinophaga rhizophila]MBW8687826.1 hypothetical protein [Chitinophaga rhizophila]
MELTTKHIMRRFLIYSLLICGLITGHAGVVYAKSPLKKSICFERLFDHEKIHIRCIDSEDLGIEEPDDDMYVFLRVTKVPRKKRYYLNTTTQQSSYTTRFSQLEHNLEFYIPKQENKTGVYQQQHAFLPAYYSFLSRYTPF